MSIIFGCPAAAGLGLLLCATPFGPQEPPQSSRGYPCSEGLRLTIVAEGPGFSIREVPQERATSAKRAGEAAGTAAIAIGKALKIDQSLLTTSGMVREVFNADRR